MPTRPAQELLGALTGESEPPPVDVGGEITAVEANRSEDELDRFISTSKADDKEVENSDRDDDYTLANEQERSKKSNKKMKNPRNSTPKYKCPYDGCEYLTDDCRKFWYHKNTHTKPYPCTWQDCDKSCSTASNLQEHSRIHTGEKPYQCAWPDCDKRFAQKSTLTIHKRAHTGERPYKCTFTGCDATFSDRSNQRGHTMTHSRKKDFVCDFQGCDRTFRRKCSMTKHKRAIHLKTPLMALQNIKQYGCNWPKCTFKATTKKEIKDHRRTHTDEPNQECNFEGCNKKFINASRLQRHQQRFHPEMFADNIKDEPATSDDEEFFDCNSPGPEEEEINEKNFKVSQQETVNNNEKESFPANDQIFVEYSEPDSTIIIQSGNRHLTCHGHLVQDEHGKVFIIPHGDMIPLQDVLDEMALQNGIAQEV